VFRVFVILFLYEYTCAAAGPVASSLAAEGRAMLTALTEDFRRVPGFEVCTLDADDEHAFRKLARTADATLVIAPEFDDLLATRSRWVLEEGGRLLGSSLEAVGLAADKLALARHLREHGVPKPVSVLSREQVAKQFLPYPLVWKPRHGAGSLATVLVRNADELDKCATIQRQELPGDEAIVQPLVPGAAASVAFLIGPRQVLPLLPGTQRLSEDGHFHYQGGTIPLPPHLTKRASRLAWQAVKVVPGLRGYVGVDLVLGPCSDGKDDQIIEINPRLTTSYLGLRALARNNLALVLVRLLEADEVQPLTWRTGSVDFTPEGNVTYYNDT
jgi:predicted ATP-grasp superfamily ATP-dependent carboligase